MIILNELMLFERHERVLVGSRAVAESFGKRHANVLRDVEMLECSAGFRELNFELSSYASEQNKKMPEILMTKNGFVFLVMGYTGEKAALVKEAYIQQFDAMEIFIRERLSTEWLVTRKQGKLVRREETDVLAQLIEYAETQGSKNMRKAVYLTYTKLVNSLVGIEAGQRDSVPFKTLSTIMFLEDMILHTIAEEMRNGTYYKEIYQKCKRNGEQIIKFAYLPRLSA